MRPQLTSADILRIAALTATLTFGAVYEAVHQSCLTSITNGDFWWHLRVGVGLGILQTHAVPHSGLYSQSATSPWLASSWLYDVAIAAGYQLIGLRVVLLTAICLKLLLGGMVFLLAGGLRGRFWTAAALTIIAQYLLLGLQPLPIYCSLLALAGMLIVLMRYRATHNSGFLYWLPLLFLLWSNLDVQFVYGVVVLFLFLAACVLECLGSPTRLIEREYAVQSLKQIGAATGASLLATLITPYGGKPYSLFFSKLTSGVDNYLPNYQSLRFRSPQDYVLLLLVMTAFLALGIRRSRDFFQISLLAFFAMLAFRSQRDAWLVIVVAIAVLANSITETTSSEQASRVAMRQFGSALALAVVIVTIAGHHYGPGKRVDFVEKIGSAFPVRAADYIRQHQLPQPLFNTLPWGGFLAWYLPEYPVAIDGRTDLYGAAFNMQYAKLMNAEVHYSTFAPFNNARTILLEKNSLMGMALPKITGFTVVYSDDIAVVLVRQEHEP